MKLKFLKNKSGFTLVEVLAVLFVISLGLIGVLSLIVQNIQSQNINKRTIAAYQLAQEGLELIRKTRDTNWRNGDAWNLNLGAGSYFMDYLDETPTLITHDTDSELYLDNNGFYIHGGVTSLTPFKRTIEIIPIDGGSMRVYAHVVWYDRDKVFNYDLETLFYDWR
ncbi:MAG: prepilin-type N-terminal cleavage/methylation domain-containing protein [Candidatus Falkowbacteria bacterium]|nr:MAG: prepilin-type N-terminal cleavage/methylation domain-containing protein [Candidatus Falkowbacteria bacterium]